MDLTKWVKANNKIPWVTSLYCQAAFKPGSTMSHIMNIMPCAAHYHDLSCTCDEQTRNDEHHAGSRPPGTLIVLKSPYPWRVEEPSIYESVRVHTAIQTGRTESDLVAKAPSVCNPAMLWKPCVSQRKSWDVAVGGPLGSSLLHGVHLSYPCHELGLASRVVRLSWRENAWQLTMFYVVIFFLSVSLCGSNHSKNITPHKGPRTTHVSAGLETLGVEASCGRSWWTHGVLMFSF